MKPTFNSKKQLSKVVTHKRITDVEPYYDVNGDIIDHNKRFPVNNDICIGDTIQVIKGVRTISGVLYANDVMRVLIKPDAQALTEEYFRYEMVYLLRNNKKIIIDRNRRVLAETELEVYISRVVLVEKYKPYELFEKDWF